MTEHAHQKISRNFAAIYANMSRLSPGKRHELILQKKKNSVAHTVREAHAVGGLLKLSHT
jgi:hypothetical protein